MMQKLPPLDYPYNALEPYIDAQTMEIHHTKHHQTYIDKLNDALENHPNLKEMPLEEMLKNLEEVPEDIRTSVRNNGGGHFSHSLFWKIMAPDAKSVSGKLKEDIEKKWGTVEKFKEEFTEAAVSRFASGWAWLSIDKNGELQISSTPNHDTPLMEEMTPIIVIDVWEHAYYLKYQNRRPEFIKNWLDNVACGDKIGEIYLSKINT